MTLIWTIASETLAVMLAGGRTFGECDRKLSRFEDSKSSIEEPAIIETSHGIEVNVEYEYINLNRSLILLDHRNVFSQCFLCYSHN